MPGGQIEYQEVPRSHELAEGVTKIKLKPGKPSGHLWQKKEAVVTA